MHSPGHGRTDGRVPRSSHISNDDDPAIVEAAAGRPVSGHSEPPAAPSSPEALASRSRSAYRSILLMSSMTRSGTEPLPWALRDEIATAARRIEVLLGLVHDPRVIGSGMATLASAVARDRSTALEMLEVTVGRPVARTLLALMSPALDDGTRMQLLSEHAALEHVPPGGWLRVLILDEDDYWHEPWLRACALYAAPTASPEEARDLALRFTDDADPVVAETARWAATRDS